MLNMLKNNLIIWVAYISFAFLAGCGGGGGSSGTNSSSTTGTSGSGTSSVVSVNANVAKIILEPSPFVSSLKADGSSKISFKVYALNGSNARIEGAQIDLTASDGLVLSKSVVTTPAVTDTSSIDYAEFNAYAESTDQSNRTVTITASCKSCLATSKTFTFDIKGGTVSIVSPTANPSNLVLRESSSVIVQVLNASGIPMKDVSVMFEKATTNSILNVSSENVITDSEGKATVQVTGTKIGENSLTIKALNDAKIQKFKIEEAAKALKYVSPLENTIHDTNKDVEIIVSAPGASQLNISSSIGVLKPLGSVTVNPSNNEAKFTINSSSAGKANITVVNPDDSNKTINLNLNFSPPSNTVNKILLSANQTTLPVKSLSTTSSIEIEARALKYDGSSDQPVANVPIDFVMSGGSGGGEYLSPSKAYTDASGVAKTTFYAGTQATSSSGISISAFVSSSPTIKTGVSPSNSDLKIAIGGKALSVALGASSILRENDDKTVYIQPYSVQVTDSSNNPVSGQLVTLRLRPVAFSTGVNCAKPFSSGSQNRFTYCSEDSNGNGSLDNGEDALRLEINDDLSNLSSCSGSRNSLGTSDSLLTPSNSDGGSIPSSVTTDSNGVANFNLTYLKASSIWVVNEMTAIVKSDGTETRKTIPFRLSPSEEDAGDKCRIPNSPYAR